jgi:type IV secretion system protein TrbH
MFRIIFIFLALSLSACTTITSDTSDFGNFISDNEAEFERNMAFDSVQQLVLLYPPASTEFALNQLTPDEFGYHLVETLRNAGYALRELPIEEKEDTLRKIWSITEGWGSELAQDAQDDYNYSLSDSGLKLNYILDQLPPEHQRITLLINENSLSRVYTIKNNQLLPGGFWAYGSTRNK